MIKKMVKCERCEKEGNNFILDSFYGRLCFNCKNELEHKLNNQLNRNSMIYPKRVN